MLAHNSFTSYSDWVIDFDFDNNGDDDNDDIDDFKMVHVKKGKLPDVHFTKNLQRAASRVKKKTFLNKSATKSSNFPIYQG